jgi:hypothetical protein
MLVYKVSEKLKGREQFGELGTWEDIIKIDYREIMWKGV